MQIPTLDDAALRAWAGHASDGLRAARSELDRLNVFPVADADTGTNLYLTVAEAAAALAALPAGPVRVAASALSRGALLGARGNSGVIVGQYLQALLTDLLARSPGDPVPVTAADLVAGLQVAADAAYRAVGSPVEGTVLTIGRAVADAAAAQSRDRGQGGEDGRAVLERAVAAGYRALALTPGQLAPLGRAGVPDAGGWGLLIVLDALLTALGGRPGNRPVVGAPIGPADETDGPDEHARVEGSLDVHRHPQDAQGGEFEVMYVVTRPSDAGDEEVGPALRTRLTQVGDSVAVVGGDGLWQVHVHTDAPLAALDVTDRAVVSQVRVRHLASQSGVHGAHRPVLGLVAVTGARGLVADLARAGAVVVLVGRGGAAGPELGRAVDDTGAGEVLVLAADDTVTAVPVGLGEDPATPVRTTLRTGLSEVAVVAGAATCAALSTGTAVQDPVGEVLAAVEAVRDAVVPAAVGGLGHADLVLTTARSLLSEEGSLLTVLAGDATDPQVVDVLRAGLKESHEAVDVVVLAAGTPGADVTLGVE